MIECIQFISSIWISYIQSHQKIYSKKYEKTSWEVLSLNETVTYKIAWGEHERNVITSNSKK